MEINRNRKRDVVIWKSAWLPVSETFVRYQATSLARWDATCLGLERISSGLSHRGDVILLGNGKADNVRRKVFSQTGISIPLLRYIQQKRPSLIHAHFANEAMKIRRIARLTNTPMVVTLHGRDVTEAPARSGLKGYVYRRRLQKVFRDATKIIAVSRHIADRAVLLGADPRKTVVHHIGIPTSKTGDYSAAQRRGVVAVGRMVEKKGFEHLIRAVSMLPNGSNIPVTIAGDGPLAPDLERLARNLGVDVSFPGAVSHDEALRLMRSSRMVCVPSVRSSTGDEEGLPTVVMEAGLSATPVVGFIHSGIPEAVDNGESGLLVREGDVAALATAMEKLLYDDDMVTSMAVKAQAKILRDFDICQQTKLLEGIYDEAIQANEG